MIKKDVILPQIPLGTEDTQREWMRGIQKALRDAQRSIASPDVTPIGAIVLWSKIDTPPSGWLICDGSAVSRAEYKDLFEITGTTYGVGDGSTTFNLPNMQRRFACGYASSQVTIDGIDYDANTFGTSNHDHMQGHIIQTGITAGGSLPGVSASNRTTNSGTSLTGTSLASDGTNGTPRTGKFTEPAHIVLNYIIKYAKNAGVDGRNGVDGDDGEDGYDGAGIIFSDSEITYDVDGNITRIDYEDGQSKVITYNLDGSIDEVLWDRGFETVNKEMAYTDGDLTAVDVTVTKIGSQGRSYSIPKRQTVLTGALDTSVYPHLPTCLEINGSDIDIKASETEPLIMAFADGYDEWGANDYVAKITADVASAWSGFAQNQRYFLYADIDDDGVLTYGKTIIPPQYGTFNPHRHSLLHFEGADESTTFTDEWGHIWTRVSPAKIDTAQYKFGTASFNNANPGYINSEFNMVGRTRWTREIWVRPTDATLLQTIFRNLPTYSLGVNISATGKLLLYASSNGSGWNLAAGTGTALGTTTLQDGTWYHIALEQQYDEYADTSILKVYLNGTLECYSTSNVSSTYEGGELIDLSRLGYDTGSQPFIGWMDEFRYSMGFNRYGNNFTVATEAFGQGDGDIHWFNIDRMEMNVGYPGAWTKKKRVFVGEVATRIDSTTIERLTVYTYQNRYTSVPISVTTGSTNYIFEHNCGIGLSDGLVPFVSYGISDNLSPCYFLQQDYVATFVPLGYASANYQLCETWRHLRFQTGTTNSGLWDLTPAWRDKVKYQFSLVRQW